MIIDGKKLARGKETELVRRVAELKARTGRDVKLTVVLVGDDSASRLYVKIKQKAAERIGIDFGLKYFSEKAGFGEVVDYLKEKNLDKKTTGLMVQLPLPEALISRTKELLDVISPQKDVDCLTSENIKLLREGRPRFIPATVKAVEVVLDEVFDNDYRKLSLGPEMFDSRGQKRSRLHPGGMHSASRVCLRTPQGSKIRPLPGVRNRRVLVVGASGMVGGPLIWHLRDLGVEVETADEHTKDLAAKTRQAEIIVSATGVPGLITGEMVKEGVAAIDVGSPKGDFDFASVAPKASLITPVPGGVGPLTVVGLLENVVIVAGH